MHMALLPNNKVIIFDRTESGPSNVSLPAFKCRRGQQGAIKKDCTAHSVEYDVATSAIRPLTLLSDTWCSSGALSPDGAVVQTGGWNSGDRVVRRIFPVKDSDWSEQPGALAVRRWYATNHVLPDGRVIVMGGRRQFNYEFVPKAANEDSSATYALPFLLETKQSVTLENNLYPFLHVAPDGNLFVFANRKAILLDYVSNKVVRNFPDMPGQVSRNYPCSASSVLLPLRRGADVEVMICGGAPSFAKERADKGVFLPASDTCGRIRISGPGDPTWTMETMPMRRVMPDMLLLPTGDVLIINGAGNGSAGWNDASNPVLHPLQYRPTLPIPSRFITLNPAATPRMYHSTAHILPDGNVLVGGSNTHRRYTFSGVPFPTDLSLEIFSPPYLGAGVSPRRPKYVEVSYNSANSLLKYGEVFKVAFWVPSFMGRRYVSVSLLSSAFTTHGFSMSQRLVVLDVVGFGFNSPRIGGDVGVVLNVTAPVNSSVAPPGYYLLFVVHGGVPSIGAWIRILLQ